MIGFDDPRLVRADGSFVGCDCFVCGHTVLTQAGGCAVESPRAGSIKLAAHRACVSHRDSPEIGVLYQSALSAALTGKAHQPERWEVRH